MTCVVLPICKIYEDTPITISVVKVFTCWNETLLVPGASFTGILKKNTDAPKLTKTKKRSGTKPTSAIPPIA